LSLTILELDFFRAAKKGIDPMMAPTSATWAPRAAKDRQNKNCRIWVAGTRRGRESFSGNDEPHGKRFLRKRLPPPSAKRDTNSFAGPNRFWTSRSCRIGVWLFVGLIFSGIVTGGAVAETGSQAVLPFNNARPKNGLRLMVDSRWIEANGYRPVRVQVIQWPPGPTPADRSFRLVLRPGAWYWGREDTAVTQFVELPEGAAVAETTVAIPQSSGWSSLGVELYEGGVRLNDLCETVSFTTSGGYQWSESTPTILIIDDDAPPRDRRNTLVQRAQFGGKRETPVEQDLPDLRPLIAQFPDQANNLAPGTTWTTSDGPADDFNTLMMVQMATRMELLPPAELPERWIDFTMFDLICLSRDDLQRLIEQHPARWQAIRAWLVAGSTLCIYGATLDAEGLGELDRLLELPPPGAAEGTESADHWQKPKRVEP
jgi:hypothetical protein